MNQKELKELIEFLIEKDIAEFELERGDVKVRIKRGSEAAPAPPVVSVMPAPIMAPPVAHAPAFHEPATSAHTPPAASPSSVSAAPAAAAEEELHMVKSPIVGTFYESPAPGTPPFVKPGDQVQAGQILCIIEAMKLMNEIESDASGEVVKVMASNGQPVEYGQPLFALRARR